MLIPIVTISKEPGLVPSHILDQMLDSGQILEFERSSGWVMVGRDPIRLTRRPHYGIERRN